MNRETCQQKTIRFQRGEIIMNKENEKTLIDFQKFLEKRDGMMNVGDINPRIPSFPMGRVRRARR